MSKIDQMGNKIDKTLDIVTDMKVDVAEIKVDVAHHIKRSDMLETQQRKIMYLLLIGAGIGIALYGPELFKLIGILL